MRLGLSYRADFAKLVVNLDNSDLAGLRTYSEKVAPAVFNGIVVDLREGTVKGAA